MASDSDTDETFRKSLLKIALPQHRELLRQVKDLEHLPQSGSKNDLLTQAMTLLCKDLYELESYRFAALHQALNSQENAMRGTNFLADQAVQRDLAKCRQIDRVLRDAAADSGSGELKYELIYVYKALATNLTRLGGSPLKEHNLPRALTKLRKSTCRLANKMKSGQATQGDRRTARALLKRGATIAALVGALAGLEQDLPKTIQDVEDATVRIVQIIATLTHEYETFEFTDWPLRREHANDPNIPHTSIDEPTVSDSDKLIRDSRDDHYSEHLAVSEFEIDLGSKKRHPGWQDSQIDQPDSPRGFGI
ncbi:hypothetical protein [Amycolatopsis sp. NPDC051128]|uniref:hypothetical protein n=1 Tax=Amycolatopsis sp. NPDC051128 TaxID=3155412 RepID=UPI0034408580